MSMTVAAISPVTQVGRRGFGGYNRLARRRALRIASGLLPLNSGRSRTVCSQSLGAGFDGSGLRGIGLRAQVF